jgi:hypothetical protein
MKDLVKVGLVWGVLMFLAMAFVWPLIDGEGITLKKVIIKFIYWIIVGLVFGYLSAKYKIAKTKFKK